MKKLIYRYSWGDEGCNGTTFIPFEYIDRDEFIYNVLKQYDKKFFKDNHYVSILGEYLTESDINNLEYNVFYYEDWFNDYKTKVEI